VEKQEWIGQEYTRRIARDAKIRLHAASDAGIPITSTNPARSILLADDACIPGTLYACTCFTPQIENAVARQHGINDRE